MVSFVAWTSALVIMLLWLAMNAGRAHSQVRTNDVLECSLAKHVWRQDWLPFALQTS